MSHNSTVDITKQIEVLRHNLLDLTMRNQLLNFRARNMTVGVVEAEPVDIYERLVLRKDRRRNYMQFLPKDDSPPEQLLSEDYSDDEVDEASILWDTPTPDSEAREKYAEQFLPTSLTSNELQRRLFYINQRSLSMMEEQGYNILYLAISFLRYHQEGENGGIREAPLLLIPVELERKRVKGLFNLKWTGEDIISNISLQSKLLEDGIEIPDFKMPRDKEGVNKYLTQVEKAISDENGWEVVNKIYLGFFSFTKFVMYKDLELESWPKDFPLDRNPIMKSIFDPEVEDSVPGFQEKEVDQRLSAREVHHVLDADSSQIAVMEDVKNGRDMVVEGPPGTGKSQTIVNLIAELMMLGKTVLFVSEKMAALEVVKGRLDQVGLGEFCLELHSRKSNKKDVLHELESTLRNPIVPDMLVEDDLNKIEELKAELNRYVKVLHQPYGEIHWTPFELYGIKENSVHHFLSTGRKMPRFNIKLAEQCSLHQWQETNSKLKELSELYKLVRPIHNNPWKNTNPDPILPAEEEEIHNMMDQALLVLEKMDREIKQLCKISGVKNPYTLEELEHLLYAVKIITSFPSLERELILNPQWDYEKLYVYNLLKDLEEYQNHRKTLTKFNKHVEDENIEEIREEFLKLKEKLLKFLSSDFKKLKKRISNLYKGNLPDDAQILLDLEEILRCQHLRQKIRDEESRAQTLFGSHWKGELSDCKNLMEISEWILKFRKALEEGRITEKVLIILDSTKQVKLKDINAQIYNSFEELLILKNRIDRYLHFDMDSEFGKDFLKLPYAQISKEFKILRGGMAHLQNWSRFSSAYHDNLGSIAHYLLDLIIQDSIEPEDILPCLEGNFADSMLRSLFLTHPALSRFVGDLHETKISEFMDLDQKIIQLNRLTIAHHLQETRPSLDSNASPRSELGILKSEFSRKRGHMPIRKLISVTGGLIQKIKPCFMMSPLSIAQYLDPHSVKNLQFDYVIFDEASQVKPEDALGALLRGKHAVIMGDTRQLPPTTFFDILMDVDNEEYDLSAIADMESILHLCKRSFPSKMLKWHYRSRHESLIAVSNQEFYDNHLLVYPSPSHDTEELGLQFIHLPDTVYDRGKTSTNHIEAKEVIKYAFEHYKKYGDEKSLGIGTFNIRQQQALLEELELQLKLHPGMEKYFSRHVDEHFFVKNLETIQGDERDVIIISVGYGYDGEGKLSLNFGPLNQDGGERRLNVLVTRAREKCVVFSNFRGHDLHLKSSSPFGLRALKVFLEYAQDKTLESDYKSQLDFETPFEDSVADFLEIHGYQVHQKVGCAGFRIDLAVVDPDYQGRYLLGIMGDGAMYHASSVTRDRDRLRQQILEGLGWNFHRIWSTDWYRNRAEVEKRLLYTLDELRDEPRDDKEFIPPITDELEFEVENAYLEKTEPDHDNPVENEKISITSVDEVFEYEMLKELPITPEGELHNLPPGELTQIVVAVVELESPVHYDEVVRRIRTLWQLTRAGSRIKKAIKEAVNLGILDGQIEQIGDFLFIKNGEIRVRKRSGDPPAQIDLISPEEIEKAINMILASQFATDPDELVRQVSRLFGMKITRGKTANKIKDVINMQLESGLVIERENGMIDLPPLD